LRGVDRFRLVSATILQFLDDHGGALTAAATVLLVVVTGWYVGLTKRLVSLQSQAQARALDPALVMNVQDADEERVVVLVRNVGSGPAMSVVINPAPPEGRVPSITGYSTPAIPGGAEETITFPFVGESHPDVIDTARFYLLYTDLFDTEARVQHWQFRAAVNVVSGERVSASRLEAGGPQQRVPRKELEGEDFFLETTPRWQWRQRRARRKELREQPVTQLWNREPYGASRAFVRRLRREAEEKGLPVMSEFGDDPIAAPPEDE
jgi:hypothetical protein